MHDLKQFFTDHFDDFYDDLYHKCLFVLPTMSTINHLDQHKSHTLSQQKESRSKYHEYSTAYLQDLIHYLQIDMSKQKDIHVSNDRSDYLISAPIKNKILKIISHLQDLTQYLPQALRVRHVFDILHHCEVYCVHNLYVLSKNSKRSTSNYLHYYHHFSC